ncbi:MAG: GNAT family N-acetyltransferase [Hyphomicrobiaceae bacterium]
MAEMALTRSDILAERSATVAGSATVRAAGSGLELALVTDIGALSGLAPEWDALVGRAGRPEQVFQSFNWCWHWCRNYIAGNGNTGPNRLAVVTGRICGQLALVMPLVVRRKTGLKQLIWLGEPVSQYGDVIAAPEAQNLECLTQAWHYCIAETRADVANLRKVREDAVVAPLLKSLGMRVTATEEAPFLDLRSASDFASYMAAHPSKGRVKNRRRQLRRLQERGPVTFDCHAGSQDAAQLASYAILLKRVWLKTQAKVSPALADKRFEAFFRDVCGPGPHPVDCKVLSIKSGNEIAAQQIVIDNAGTRFLHVAVYSGKFEKAGAGALLLEHLIESCYAHGVHRLDLLPPRHDYKLDFANGILAVHDHALALTTAGSLYTSGYLGLRRRLKAGVEAMPAPLRTAVGIALSLAKGGRR